MTHHFGKVTTGLHPNSLQNAGGAFDLASFDEFSGKLDPDDSVIQGLSPRESLLVRSAIRKLEEIKRGNGANRSKLFAISSEERWACRKFLAVQNGLSEPEAPPAHSSCSGGQVCSDGSAEFPSFPQPDQGRTPRAPVAAQARTPESEDVIMSKCFCGREAHHRGRHRNTEPKKDKPAKVAVEKSEPERKPPVMVGLVHHDHIKKTLEGRVVEIEEAIERLLQERAHIDALLKVYAA